MLPLAYKSKGDATKVILPSRRP